MGSEGASKRGELSGVFPPPHVPGASNAAQRCVTAAGP